jgi:hypothetical protein
MYLGTNIQLHLAFGLSFRAAALETTLKFFVFVAIKTVWLRSASPCEAGPKGLGFVSLLKLGLQEGRVILVPQLFIAAMSEILVFTPDVSLADPAKPRPRIDIKQESFDESVRTAVQEKVAALSPSLHRIQNAPDDKARAEECSQLQKLVQS